jgi:tetratricopeptide (TPR) repeat protein
MVRALILSLALSFAGLFQPQSLRDRDLEILIAQLPFAPNAIQANEIATDILRLWAQSGSPTVDLLMAKAGEAADEADDPKRAIALLDRALSLDPKFAEGYTRRAAQLYEATNYAAALDDLNTALSLEPNHFVAWTGVGAVLEDMGNKPAALAAYRKALRVYPGFEAAQRGEARLSAALEGIPS